MREVLDLYFFMFSCWSEKQGPRHAIFKQAEAYTLLILKANKLPQFIRY